MKITPETQANAQAVLDYIHDHPKDHDQTMFWFNKESEGGCGTSMCIAGTAVYLEYGIQDANAFFASEIGNGNNFRISDAAGDLLGLENEDEHNLIFFEYNNEAAVQQLKHLITGDSFAFLTHKVVEA